MTHVKLDGEDDVVKRFIRSLPIHSEGVDLELEGQVICKVVPPLRDAEKLALIERGRELVRRARESNRAVPASVIEREVRSAVDEVRRRKSQ